MRFSDVEVQRMVEAGLLDDRRVELIDGDLVGMSPRRPVHANLTVWIQDLVRSTYAAEGHHVRTHSPIDVSPHDQPEPDVALVRGPPTKADRYPRGADLILVVEISRTTLAKDREEAAVYARGGVPAY